LPLHLLGDPNAAPSRLTDVSVAVDLFAPKPLTALCQQLPALTRLQLRTTVYRRVGPIVQTEQALLRKLQQLHVHIASARSILRIEHVCECDQLRVLQLSYPLLLPLKSLVQILQRNAATLEELRLDKNTELGPPADDAAAAAVGHSLIAAVTACAKLRVVGFNWSPAPAWLLLRALPAAPALQSLELVFPTTECTEPSNDQLQENLRAADVLARMMESASWSSTHVRLNATHVRLDATAIEAVWPAAAAAADTMLRRMYLLHCWADTRCFALQRGAAGQPLCWQLEYFQHE